MFTLQLRCRLLYIISLACHNHGKIVTCLPQSVATHGCAAERRVNYREAQPAPKGKIILPNAVYLFVVAAASLKNIWVACDCLLDVRRISKNINTHILYLSILCPSIFQSLSGVSNDQTWFMVDSSSAAAGCNSSQSGHVHVYQSRGN
jgi:hypothetical protein